jgi:hypothetical protein
VLPGVNYAELPEQDITSTLRAGLLSFSLGSGVGVDSSWDKLKGGMIDDKKRR